MAYRETRDAEARARDRLRLAEERTAELSRALELTASELSDAMRALELTRLTHGAAIARVRQLSALLATQPDEALRQDLQASHARAEETRARIPICESTIAERRTALKAARRALGIAERERRSAERELERIQSAR